MGSRLKFLLELIAIPFIINMLAGIVLLVGLDASSPIWWIFLGIAIGTTLLLPAVSWRFLRRRYLALRILREISSSRCADHFIQFATVIFKELKNTDEALRRLGEIANIRRHPNKRLLGDLSILAKRSKSGDLSKDRAARYLQEFKTIKQSARTQVTDFLVKFVRELPRETLIVLYGYSTTICDALTQSSLQVPFSVFLVEDMQYGPSSLEEHRNVQSHLRVAGIEPILIPFAQIAALQAKSVHFVTSSDGKSIPLSARRRITVLLGCEAITLDGDVLIPSRVSGAPSETAKFVEIFHQTIQPESCASEIIIVSESYKVHEAISEDDQVSFSPTRRLWWRDLLYAIGLMSLPKGQRVELVRLPATDLAAIIDDAGIHRGPDLDMRRSYDLWCRRALGPMDPPNTSDRGVAEILTRAKSVIFDLNGVLMDDEGLNYNSFADTLRVYKLSLTYVEYLRHCAGLTDEEGMKNLVLAKNVNASLSDLVETKGKFYKQHRGSHDLPPAFPSAVEAARYIGQTQGHCFLVTSTDEESAVDFLEKHSLQTVFPIDRSYFAVSSAERADVYREIGTCQ
jgi:hypothetical protein